MCKNCNNDNNNIEARIDKTQQNCKCSLCGDREETINHNETLKLQWDFNIQNFSQITRPYDNQEKKREQQNCELYYPGWPQNKTERKWKKDQPGGFGSWRTWGDHLKDSIIEDSQNTEKSPGDLRRLTVSQTSMKDHQLTLIWKTL